MQGSSITPNGVASHTGKSTPASFATDEIPMNTNSRDHKTFLALHKQGMALRACCQSPAPGLLTFADLK